MLHRRQTFPADGHHQHRRPHGKSTAFRTFLNGDESPEALLQRYVTMALEGTRNLTNDLGPLTRLVQACIGKVYIAGNLLRPLTGPH